MSNTKKTVTIYVTKYALTTGIFTAQGEQSSDDSFFYKVDGSSFTQYARGNDVHLTEEAALNRAEEMRISKLKALDKQMKKVSAMKFEVK